MATQARQISRVGVSARLSNNFGAITYPANQPAYVSGGVAVGIGLSSQQQKTNTPSTGQSLTFSLSSSALAEGFSLTGNTVYYTNPNVANSSAVAVATVDAKGNLTATNNIISTPVYGSVNGSNQYLGSVQYVPNVSGSNIGFTYSGFTGASVSETYKVYVPDYALGRYIPIGVTISGNTSYNQASNQVSVNFPGFYGPGTAPVPPSQLFLTPQTVPGSVFGLPSNVGVRVNETVSFAANGNVTTSVIPTGGFSVGGKVVPTFSTVSANAGGSQTTAFTVGNGGIITSTSGSLTISITTSGAIAVSSYSAGTQYFSPSTPLGQYYAKLAASTLTSSTGGAVATTGTISTGLVGGNAVPANGVYIPQGGSPTVGIPTLGNKFTIGGRTYNINFGTGQPSSGSSPATSSPSLNLGGSATSGTSGYSYISSTTVQTGSILLQQSGPAQQSTLPYSNLGASSFKSLPPASGSYTIVSNSNSSLTSIAMYEAQGYSLSQAKEMVTLQGYETALASVKNALGSTIGQIPLVGYGNVTNAVQSQNQALFTLYSNASASTKVGVVGQILLPYGLAFAEGYGIGRTPTTILTTAVGVGLTVGEGLIKGQTSPKQIASNAAAAFTFLGVGEIIIGGTSSVFGVVGKAVTGFGAAVSKESPLIGGPISAAGRAIGPAFAYGSAGVLLSDVQSILTTGHGITALRKAEIIGGTAIFAVGGNAAVDQIFGKAPTSITINDVSRAGFYEDMGTVSQVTLNRPITSYTMLSGSGAQEVAFVPEPDESFSIANKNYQLSFGPGGVAQYAFSPTETGYNLQGAYQDIIYTIGGRQIGNPYTFLRALVPQETQYTAETVKGQNLMYTYSGTATGVTNLGTPATIEFTGKQPVTMTEQGLVGEQSSVQGTATVTLTSGFREFLNEQFGVALPTKTFAVSSITPSSLTSGIDASSNLASILSGGQGTFAQATYAGSAVSRIQVQTSDYVMLSGVMTSGARTIGITDVLYDPNLGAPQGTRSGITIQSPSGGSSTTSGAAIPTIESFTIGQVSGIEPGQYSASSSSGGQALVTAPAVTATESAMAQGLTKAMPFQSGAVTLADTGASALFAPPDPSVLITPGAPHSTTTSTVQPSFNTGPTTAGAGRATAGTGISSKQLPGQTTISNAQAPGSYLQASQPNAGLMVGGFAQSLSVGMAFGGSGPATQGIRTANAGPFEAPAVEGLTSGSGLPFNPTAITTKKKTVTTPGHSSLYASFTETGFKPLFDIGNRTINQRGYRTEYKPFTETGFKPITETTFKPVNDVGRITDYKTAGKYAYKPYEAYGYKPALSYKTKVTERTATTEKTVTTTTTPPPPPNNFNITVNPGGRLFSPGARKQTKRPIGQNAFKFRPQFEYNVDLTAQTFNIKGVRGSKRAQEAFGLARPYF
jgi:hypothetical protein